MRRALCNLVLGGFIACALQSYKQPEIVLECPPKEVYAPLRVNLYLAGVLPDAAEGSICKFYGRTDKGKIVIEYKNSKGQWRKAELDAQQVVIRMKSAGLNVQ